MSLALNQLGPSETEKSRFIVNSVDPDQTPRLFWPTLFANEPFFRTLHINSLCYISGAIFFVISAGNIIYNSFEELF